MLQRVRERRDWGLKTSAVAVVVDSVNKRLSDNVTGPGRMFFLPR